MFVLLSTTFNLVSSSQLQGQAESLDLNTILPGQADCSAADKDQMLRLFTCEEQYLHSKSFDYTKYHMLHWGCVCI